MRTRAALLGALVAVTMLGAVTLGRGALHSASSSPAVERVSLSIPHTSPVSVSFDSLENGWTLATTSCDKRRNCLTLLETSDRGRTWSKRSLPAALLANADRSLDGTAAAIYGAANLNVRFANQHDGWIYGTLPGKVPPGGVSLIQYGPTMWSTHDGGQVWHRVHLTWANHEPSIFDLETSRGTVYAETMSPTYHVTLSSSPVSEDDWQDIPTGTLYLPAGGAQPTGAIVLSGSSGWLVAGNDRGVSASLRLINGHWTKWTPPCESVGNSYVVPAAATPRDLVVICQMGGFAYSLSPSAPSGATVGSNWFYFSSDGGRTFHSGPELKPRNFYFNGVLASPAPGEVVLSRGPGGVDKLMVSFNDGRTWRVVYNGAPIYLSFISPAQGAALIQRHYGDNSLIMTFNGGRTWRQIHL